ncbi:MAG: hypothetical protein QN187_11080 [Armatimonadota bacterium]|nr:hypothetical protein [Armatimonadota bacterium]
MRRRALCGGLLIAAVIVAAAGAGPATAAGEVTVVRLPGRAGGAELRVRGQAVARLHGPDGARRLLAAGRRLERLLAPPTTVSASFARREARLMVDGHPVLGATRSDAARLGMSAETLVRRWADALEAALAVPPITVAPAALVLSPGRSAVAALATTVSGPVVLGSFDRTVAEVRLGPGAVRVRAGRVGSTVVPLRVGPYRAQLAVAVRPPAGVIPSETEVLVTGAPATPDLIREAAARRLQEVVRRDPGARLAHGAIEVDGPLPPGASVTVPVAVGLRSPYAGPVDGTLRLKVTNVPVEPRDPEILLVSNRPETIAASGRLFQETLTTGRAARLLYHHRNGPGDRTRVIKITLSNSGASRARVHYAAGVAGPSSDPLQIGFAATARFLEALLAGRGYVVEVPPQGSATFAAQTLAPGALVSGIMQFQVIEGGPVALTVHVRLPWLLDGTVTADLGPWAFPHPRGTFPGSAVEIVREVPVHAPAAIADLGVASGLHDVRTGEPLVGDYGVLYRLRLVLTNPTDREVTAALVATAAGGLARGLFVIDGVPTDAGLLRPGEDRALASLAVAPLAAREVAVLTMPMAGSFYPVRLGLRPR